jgi:hypothetical protein
VLTGRLRALVLARPLERSEFALKGRSVAERRLDVEVAAGGNLPSMAAGYIKLYGK